MPEFIFMLTQQDRTVANAIEVLHAVKNTGLKHVGFKDIGVDALTQRELVEIAHGAGLTVHLEVVGETLADEMSATEAGLAAGVDWILGGKRAEPMSNLIGDSGVKFAPFAGSVVGHPSELRGAPDTIVAHAQSLVDSGAAGVDLLAFRHKGEDPLFLAASVANAIDKPLIVAGSVASIGQVLGLREAGAWGYTIGGAIFDGRLPGEKDVVAQVRTALGFASH